MKSGESDQQMERAVLELLAAGPRLGYDAAGRATAVTGAPHCDAYALLYTLESRGLIEGVLELSPDGGERRWYSLTTKGQRVLSVLRRSAQDGARVLGAIALAGGAA